MTRARPDQQRRRRSRRQPRAGSSIGSARRATPGPISCSSRSSRSRATRPRICSCGRGSSAPRGARSSEIAAETHGIVALVGAPQLDADLSNACYVLAGGEIRHVYRKRFLPNYGVFDEDRYFAPGHDLSCSGSGRQSSGRRSARTSGSPARLRPISRWPVPSSSRTSPPRRSTSARTGSARRCSRVRARDNSCFIAFCNAVGGQDELIFDGHSLVLDDEGELIARAPGFEEALLVVDVDPAAAIGRRLRDVRRRALARERPDLRASG